MKDLYGLLGFPLGHSYSPLIHKYIFEEVKRDGEYKLLETHSELVLKTLKEVKQKDFKGINVTIPYKQKVISYMDLVSDQALKIHAVNTIKVTDEGLEGYNTDYIGFMELLSKNNIDVSSKKVLILGDGGAANTVYHCMNDLKASVIYVASRKQEKVRKLFPKGNVISYEDIYIKESYDIVVNCTPLGMYPKQDQSPLDINRMPSVSVYVDLIYNPAKTMLMEAVEKTGGIAINGLYMLVAQAVAAQEIWTETKISKDVTDMVYNRCLNGQNIKIMVLNGPNLNMLGIREPAIYGQDGYESLCKKVYEEAERLNIDVEIRQSNYEGKLVDLIQSAYGKFDGIVINPAAYSHYSIALLDALKAVGLPAIEVHISDISKREDFRKHSVTKAACIEQISGKGLEGYLLALRKLVKLIKETEI